jgi:AcrR family transcriptional regulator
MSILILKGNAVPRISNEEKARTRRLILNEATRLFVSRGYEPTSCREISRACGIADGTLYNYFPTKEALLLAVLERIAPGVEKSKSVSQGSIVDFCLSAVDALSAIPYRLFAEVFSVSMKDSEEGSFLFRTFIEADNHYIETIGQALEEINGEGAHRLSGPDFAYVLYSTILTAFILHIRTGDPSGYEAFRKELSDRLEKLISLYLHVQEECP